MIVFRQRSLRNDPSSCSDRTDIGIRQFSRCHIGMSLASFRNMFRGLFCSCPSKPCCFSSFRDGLSLTNGPQLLTMGFCLFPSKKFCPYLGNAFWGVFSSKMFLAHLLPCFLSWDHARSSLASCCLIRQMATKCSIVCYPFLFCGLPISLTRLHNINRRTQPKPQQLLYPVRFMRLCFWRTRYMRRQSLSKIKRPSNIPYSLCSWIDQDIDIPSSQDIFHVHSIPYFVLCGYDTTHDELLAHGWTTYHWLPNGGYGNQGQGRGRANKLRETIWASPACLVPGSGQLTLFGEGSL
jgi:hypothetical protein